MPPYPRGDLGPSEAWKSEMSSDLEERFDDAMMEIYQRAKSEANYNATRFLQMLLEHRGLKTAQLLLDAGAVSEGYSALWRCKRLDLTVEAQINDNPQWHPLLTPKELAIAKRRLEEFGYDRTTRS